MIRWLARLSVDNPVAVNLGMIAVTIAGVTAYGLMPREVFPEFGMKLVHVTTSWPGASPEDVERLVTLPLEEKLDGLDGLEKMTSRSQEGFSTIALEVLPEQDVQSFIEDVRNEITTDVELPVDANETRVKELEQTFPVIAVFVYGEVPEEELVRFAERHRRGLEQIPGVSRVTPGGDREPRIWVEVDPLALERHGLTLEQVGLAVGGRARDAPLGSLSTESGDFLLRVDSRVERAEDLRDLPVVARSEGAVVRLGDVARVVDTWERPATLVRFNGVPAIHLQVDKQESGDIIDIAAAARAYVASHQAELPPGVHLGFNSDLSVYVRNRLNVMRDSGTIGALLVLVSLVIFLNVRIALLTAIGIPLSFLGGLLLAGSLGISMNMMTMFALIIVLGMVVDDAIVVGENVYRLREEGLSPVQAAIQGTAEVGKPVAATILTTVAAFLPMLMIGGTMGKFLQPIPLIVTFCLLASLTEALLVLPSHLAHWSGRHVEHPPHAAAPRRWYDPLRDRYTRFLETAVRYRYVTLAAAVAVTVLSIGLAVYRIPFTLFDEFESKVFYVNLRTAPDSSLEHTAELAAALEQRVRELPPEELESTNLLAGVSYTDASRFSVGQNLGQVWVELREDQEGRRPTSAIIEELRTSFASPPAGVESIEVDQPQAGPTGRAIDISIRGPDLDVLQRISAELQADLSRAPGVRDVRDTAEEGKREVRLRLTDHGRLLGFDEARLAAELRAAFEGTRFARLRRGLDDVEIIVKLPEELRADRGGLARLRVTSPPEFGGARVPLGSVAELHEESGLSVISRDEGVRSLRVVADVNKKEGNAQEIIADIRARYADLGDRWPGYTLAFEGDYQETMESIAGLLLSSVIALTVMYLILGTLFRSFSQPLVIMLAIPLSACGMVLGHLLMGRMLSFMSLIGGLALAGVVVNDSLILIDFVNVRRRAGAALEDALVTAGRLRFRPIILTSITTMLGLSPLTFFASGQARFLQPMAISIFFGLATATALILVVVPCAYGALMDLHELLGHPRRSFAALRRGETIHLPPSPTQSPGAGLPETS